MEKTYNLKETADVLRVKVRTIRNWVHNGTIKANKIEGTNRWIVMESEINRILGKESHHEN